MSTIKVGDLIQAVRKGNDETRVQGRVSEVGRDAVMVSLNGSLFTIWYVSWNTAIVKKKWELPTEPGTYLVHGGSPDNKAVGVARLSHGDWTAMGFDDIEVWKRSAERNQWQFTPVELEQVLQDLAGGEEL